MEGGKAKEEGPGLRVRCEFVCGPNGSAASRVTSKPAVRRSIDVSALAAKWSSSGTAGTESHRHAGPARHDRQSGTVNRSTLNRSTGYALIYRVCPRWCVHMPCGRSIRSILLRVRGALCPPSHPKCMSTCTPGIDGILRVASDENRLRQWLRIHYFAFTTRSSLV